MHMSSRYCTFYIISFSESLKLNSGSNKDIMKMYLHVSLPLITIYVNLPSFGHIKHCPDETNDAPDNLKQHWLKDNKLSPIDSPSQ